MGSEPVKVAKAPPLLGTPLTELVQFGHPNSMTRCLVLRWRHTYMITIHLNTMIHGNLGIPIPKLEDIATMDTCEGEKTTSQNPC